MAKKKSKTLDRVPETYLTDQALEHWNKIMPVLISDGVVKQVDVPIIEAGCEMYARYLHSLELDEGDDAIKYLKMYIAIVEKYGATQKARHTMKLETAAVKEKKEDAEIMKEFAER